MSNRVQPRPSCYSMCMSTLTRRVQLLLDEDRYARIEGEARRSGASVASVIRQAIDRHFADDTMDRARAAQLLLDAAPIPVDDWSVLKAEIEGMRNPLE